MKRNDPGIGFWTRRDLLKTAAALAWVVPAFAQAPRGQRGQPAAAQTGTQYTVTQPCQPFRCDTDALRQYCRQEQPASSTAGTAPIQFLSSEKSNRRKIPLPTGEGGPRQRAG